MCNNHEDQQCHHAYSDGQDWLDEAQDVWSVSNTCSNMCCIILYCFIWIGFTWFKKVQTENSDMTSGISPSVDAFRLTVTAA